MPVVGFTWYSLQDQIDWNIGLSKALGNVFPVGLFDLNRDPRPLAQALREAAAKARRKADSLASALNLTIVRVLSVTESTPVAVPFSDVAYVRAEKSATPIEPGTIEVRATVSLVVEIR